MERDVIQIAVMPDGKIVALCSDSTIWIKGNDWVEVKSVPGLAPKED